MRALHVLGHLEDFENSATSSVAGAAAAFATSRRVDRFAVVQTERVIPRIGGDIVHLKHLLDLAAIA